ncbi:MAG: hypothetical protein GY822_08055 [Deltaproteobacteria bacterium]|nr:hypothetical protein [Deltaproteobacteria bacterium]
MDEAGKSSAVDPVHLVALLEEPYLSVPMESAKWSSRMGMWWLLIFAASTAMFALQGNTWLTWTLFVLMAGGLFLRTSIRALRFSKALGFAQAFFFEGQTHEAELLYVAMARDAGSQAQLRAIAIVQLAACALREGNSQRTLALLSGVERAPLFVGAMPEYAAESALMLAQANTLLGELEDAQFWLEEAARRLPADSKAGIAVSTLFFLAREERFHTALDVIAHVEEVLVNALDDIEWQRIQFVRAFCMANIPEGKTVDGQEELERFLNGVTRRWTAPMTVHWPALASFFEEGFALAV